MKDHPIEGLILTAMESIRSMVDVNTIVSEPIIISDKITIIPISKIGFGLGAGGSDFNKETVHGYTKNENLKEEIQYKLPFGGGTGVGANIVPIAFLIIQENTVRLMPVNHDTSIDKILDYIPDLLGKIENYIKTKKEEN